MTMIALHEPPRSSEAAREQLRAVESRCGGTR